RRFRCRTPASRVCVGFCFNAPAPAAIYTLSLHDALPICAGAGGSAGAPSASGTDGRGPVDHGSSGAAEGSGACPPTGRVASGSRSEEHTSELQSRENLVCRLLLEKKKNTRQKMWALGTRS